MTCWIYKETERGVFTVGYYSPEREFMTDSDHDSYEAAAARVSYLNGGQPNVVKRAFNREVEIEILLARSVIAQREKLLGRAYHGSWHELTLQECETRARAEMAELLACTSIIDKRAEAADVMNYLSMLIQKCDKAIDAGYDSIVRGWLCR